MKIKISKKLLADYRKLKKQIPLLEIELSEMKQGDHGFGSSTILDYRTGEPRAQNVVGFDWPRYERRKKILERKRAKVEAVEQWIDAIEDGQARYVFRMFYIDGMTWEKIALRTGYSDSPDYPRLHIRDRYLKEHKIG